MSSLMFLINGTKHLFFVVLLYRLLHKGKFWLCIQCNYSPFSGLLSGSTDPHYTCKSGQEKDPHPDLEKIFPRDRFEIVSCRKG